MINDHPHEKLEATWTKMGHVVPELTIDDLSPAELEHYRNWVASTGDQS